MKKIEIISIDEIYSGTEFYLELTGLTKEECENRDSDMFECDPDYINFNHVEMAYVAYSRKDTIYIVHNNYLGGNDYYGCQMDTDEYMARQEIMTMLEDFYLKEEANFSFDRYSTHEDWTNKVRNGIKYRGGSGYSYGIYEYVGFDFLKKYSKEQLMKVINKYVLEDVYYGEYEEFEEEIKNFIK